MRNPLRMNWEKVEGKVVAQNLVKRADRNTPVYGHIVIKTIDYMVEVAGPDGTPTRLVIREDEHKLRLPEQGQPVPLLVNSSRTKAAFDLDGTSIDVVGRQKRHEQQKKIAAKRRKEKFERKLRGD